MARNRNQIRNRNQNRSRFGSETRSNPRRLNLEHLDARICMSVETSLGNDGVLTVKGTEGDDSIAIVGQADGTVQVRDLNGRERHRFENVSKIQVETLGGDDQVRVNTRGWQQVDLSVDSGDGDDAVLIGLLLPAVQKVRESAARVDVETHGGNDRVSVQVDGFEQTGLSVDSGEGDDSVEARIGLLLPAVQKVREAAARVRVDTHGGDDRIAVRTEGIEQVGLGVDSGSGDDTVVARVGLLLPAVQKVRATVAARPAMNLDLTAGQDAEPVGLLLPAVQKVREAAARMQVETGDGDDRLSIRTQGVDRVDLDVDSGAGDDDARIALLLPAVQKVQEPVAEATEQDDPSPLPVDLDVSMGDGDDHVTVGLLLPAVQKVREAAARMRVDLGSGDDRATIRSLGATAVDLALSAGDGDDDVAIGLLLPAVQKVRASIAKVAVDLGAGTDDLKLRVRGYDQVHASIESDEFDTIDDGNTTARPRTLAGVRDEK